MIFAFLFSLWLTVHAVPRFATVCKNNVTDSLPYCNPELSKNERMIDLLSRLPTKTKVLLLADYFDGEADVYLPQCMNLFGVLE